jgi:hypothetical protein
MAKSLCAVAKRALAYRTAVMRDVIARVHR